MILAFVEAKMDFLLNANVAYVLLVIGVMLGFMALIAPGTGMLEVSALFALALAGYGAYNLEINGWAFIPLALAIAPFLYALQVKVWRTPLLIATILLVVIGSVFLFKGQNGAWLGVNPLLAGLVSILSSGILWVMVDKALAAMHTSPAHNPDALLGQVGEARTKIKEEGSVQIDGELWSARSESPIAAGSAVRVLRREGFILVVEKVSQ
jgi:membrane-bound serine protease (ClpP class)